MGHKSRQIGMQIIDMEEMILQGHPLRKIDRLISFDFIYEMLASYYPSTGRPSVDPVSMFKMLLEGYLYGVKSERRLVEEVQLNIAYRWFCGFELHEKIPDHTTFSKTYGDSGYIHHGDKRGVGYLMEATVDCKSEILTGVDVYSANQKESLLGCVSKVRNPVNYASHTRAEAKYTSPRKRLAETASNSV